MRSKLIPRRRPSPIRALARRRRIARVGIAGIGALIAAKRRAEKAKTLARRMR